MVLVAREIDALAVAVFRAGANALAADTGRAWESDAIGGRRASGGGLNGLPPTPGG
jgi:hypothetical protein